MNIYAFLFLRGALHSSNGFVVWPLLQAGVEKAGAWHMLSSPDAAHFTETPIGHWYAGRTFLVWNQSPTLQGLTLWGRPTAQDVVEIFLAVDASRRHSPRCDVVTDMSRLESMDAAAYASLLNGTRERQDHDGHRVGRHALVRAQGLLGGLAEGFFPLVGAARSWRIFAEPAGAFEWISPAKGAALRPELEQIVVRVCGTPALLRKLRDFLREHLADTALPEAARALGLSDRSLQRALQKLGTRFHEELHKARIELGQQALD